MKPVFLLGAMTMSFIAFAGGNDASQYKWEPETGHSQAEQEQSKAQDLGGETVSNRVAKRIDQDSGLKTNACEARVAPVLEDVCQTADLMRNAPKYGVNKESNAFRSIMKDIENGAGFYKTKQGLRSLGARLAARVKFWQHDDVNNYKFARCADPAKSAKQLCSAPGARHDIYSLKKELNNLDYSVLKGARKAKNPENRADLLALDKEIRDLALDPAVQNIDQSELARKSHDRIDHRIGRALKTAEFKTLHPFTPAPNQDLQFGDQVQPAPMLKQQQQAAYGDDGPMVQQRNPWWNPLGIGIKKHKKQVAVAPAQEQTYQAPVQEDGDSDSSDTVVPAQASIQKMVAPAVIPSVIPAAVPAQINRQPAVVSQAPAVIVAPPMDYSSPFPNDPSSFLAGSN